MQTPREVVEALLSGISSGPTAALADLYAVDAVVELPFAPPDGLVLRGREELRAHFDRAGKGALRLTPQDVMLYETSDPEVVIAEYAYRIERGARTLLLANVQIVRVRDGVIVSSRDFHDHAGLRAAMSLPE